MKVKPIKSDIKLIIGNKVVKGFLLRSVPLAHSSPSSLFVTSELAVGDPICGTYITESEGTSSRDYNPCDCRAPALTTVFAASDGELINTEREFHCTDGEIIRRGPRA